MPLGGVRREGKMMNKIEFASNNGKAIEGFLGDEKKCEILFILREPNSSGESPTDFWFRNVLDGKCVINDSAPKQEVAKAKRIATKYINVLGRLQNIITKKNEINTECLITNLKRCCYINLHPHCGESRASEKYANMLKNFKNKSESGAKDRWDIIDGLIDKYECKHIVTVPDIFSAFCPTENELSKCVLNYGDKEFKIGEYRKAMVYEFYHPSYSISYEKLNMARILGKI